MALILKPDLDMVNMYQNTQDEVRSFSGSKVTASTDEQTHTDTTKIISSRS